MRPWVRNVLLSSTVVAVAGFTATWFMLVRPLMLRGRQVRTCADIQAFSGFVEKYKEAHGYYPRQLNEALPEKLARYANRDVWGAPFHYESDGTFFVLASLGRDRRPDFADFRHVRDVAPTADRDWSACDVRGVWNADQIRSDRGWHRQAGK